MKNLQTAADQGGRNPRRGRENGTERTPMSLVCELHHSARQCVSVKEKPGRAAAQNNAIPKGTLPSHGSTHGYKEMGPNAGKLNTATASIGPNRELSTLLGRPLHNESGSLLGTITDAVVDCADGQVTHLVIRNGESTTYIPWRSVTFDANVGSTSARPVAMHRHRSRSWRQVSPRPPPMVQIWNPTSLEA
jgi:sporulation protein YlmC with PRC-barrel domain